jgi:hypothetical protein
MDQHLYSQTDEDGTGAVSEIRVGVRIFEVDEMESVPMLDVPRVRGPI